MVKKIAFAFFMIPSFIAAQAESESSFSLISGELDDESSPETKFSHDCLQAAHQLTAFIRSHQLNDIIHTYVRTLNEKDLLELTVWHVLSLEVFSVVGGDVDFNRLAEVCERLVQELDKVVEQNYDGNKRLCKALYKLREYVVTSQAISLDQILQKYVNILTRDELSTLNLTLTFTDKEVFPHFGQFHEEKMREVITHIEKLIQKKTNRHVANSLQL